MVKKNKQTFLRRFFDFLILPILLVALWLLVSLLFDRDSTFLTIIFNHNQSDFISVKDTKLLAGQKVIGKFIAKENNLGIIAVRFNTYKQINDDVLIFRLKQANAKNWYYTAKYKVNQFQPNQLFTFGFPVIADAKNKQYVFEIESTIGKKGNAVSVSYDEPVYVTKYKFTRSELTNNKIKLVVFLVEKTFTSFQRLNFIIASLTYIVPLIIIYLLWLHTHGQFAIRNYYIFYIFCILSLLNIIFFDLQLNLILLVLLGLWIFIIKIYKLDHSVSFLGMVVCLGIIIVLMMMNLEKIAEGFAIWAYLFLLCGTLQIALETIQPSMKRITYTVFFKKIWQSIRYKARL